VNLGFSVDQALNATTPEREVQDVADLAVQAVKRAFPNTAACTFTTRFVHGGVAPRARA
jgi:hypothetical protein